MHPQYRPLGLGQTRDHQMNLKKTTKKITCSSSMREGLHIGGTKNTTQGTASLLFFSGKHKKDEGRESNSGDEEVEASDHRAEFLWLQTLQKTATPEFAFDHGQNQRRVIKNKGLIGFDRWFRPSTFFCSYVT